ncbi:hypothetical protein RJ640_022374 [Escallonia rubra]|uniref:GAG-pre-integrase domain-containing protein n=1 Tax=Escallonia rubra TaxID=112253 RepID=A0AA88UA00_9ASTE|nr:hypothetical protein RJ640_022374 [Escallonia rubra]
MCRVKSTFKDIDESEKKLVRLGDNKPIQVEGKGTVVLMACGYSILFDDGVYMIEDKKSGQIMASVHMAENMIFPLEVSNVDKKVLIASERNATNLWHLRYGHLHVRGLKLLSQKVHQKLDEKSEKCIFIGYCSHSKAYRLYNPINGKVIISRNVVFDEDGSWSFSEDDRVQAPSETPTENDNVVVDPTPTNSTVSSPMTSDSDISSSLTSSDETLPRKFRSLREIYETCTFALFASDLTYFEEAVEHEEWCEAMKEEITAIQKNETRELVDLLWKGVYTGVGSWVFGERRMGVDEAAVVAAMNAVATPMKLNEKLRSQDGTDAANGKVFRSIVGGLIYLTHTRSDISFSVSVVSSDWARSGEDRKSTSGNIFILGSGAVSWSSKKQATTAPSSTEAEYVAATSSTCQALWLTRLLVDFLMEQQ